jgi:hypothetical protein
MASRYLNNITINDAYTFPTADGTEGQIITTDGSGTLSFADAAASDAIVLTVKNISGGSLAKGTVVHPSPSASPPSGNILEVIAADKSAASTMPAIGVLNETLADDGEGECIAFGSVTGIDTSSFSASDPIYVGASGAFTATKPSGTDLIQKIGIVVKAHASNGSIKVFGANRTNDVPAPLYVDIPNSKVGIGQSSPDVSLDINATDAIQMPAGTTAQRPTAQAGMFRYNTTDGKFEGYTTEWGEIGGGGGGDTGTVTIEKNIYTGDGSDTTFDTTSTIVDERNVQIYIDGVYQSKDNYTTSGSTVTFSTAPLDGSSIELIHIVAITGQTSLDKFTGDGSTTAFNLSQTIDSENNVQIYIDGVYQSKDNYSTSGKTLTFTTAPSNSAAIEAVHIKAVDLSAMNSDQFTGDGSTTAFSLTNTPSSEDKTLVFVQGVYQEKSTYSVSGSTLTFTTAPPDGYTIEVTVYSKITIVDNTVNIERFTGDGSDTNFVLTNAPSSANNLDVYISGLYQEKNTYTFSGSTITLDEAPVDGAVIECRSIANISNVVAADNDFHKFQWITTIKTAAFTAVSNRGYFVNTTSAAITVTLPSSPTAGDEVTIVDYAGTADTNNITITSSNNINGSSNDVKIDYTRGGVSLVYVDATQGWVTYNAANETDVSLNSPYDIEYLSIAGGGGGGYQNAGGGGAGGFLSGTISSISLNQEITITIGAGAAGGTKSPAAVNNGSDTTISYTSTTLTSIGGGGGSSDNNAIVAGDGGSGGGGAGGSGVVTGGSGTTGQGNDGGDGGSGVNRGGGGGGAGAVGQDANSSGANGGVGSTTTIISTSNATSASVGEVDSSSLYFSGGGGGDNRTVFGSGGLGGGTDAAANPIDASANTGGGGGSAYNGTPVRGANGGSGVVILKIPTASFSNKTTGSPTEFTEGSNKILVFKSSGTYTT